jgi:cytochrome P450
MTTSNITHKRTAPGPRGNFLFGNLPDLWRNPLEFYPEIRERYGDVVRLRGVGGLSWYLVSHPNDIEHVFKSKQYPKGLFVETVKLLVGNGLITSEGEFWRRQRRLASPAFHRQRLINLSTMMTASAERVVERWEVPASQGQPVDVAQDMMALTLEIVGRALFNVDLSKAADEVGHALTVALEYVNHRSLNPLSLPEQFPTRQNRRFKRARQTIDQLMYQIIEDHRRNPSTATHGDLLTMLLEARDEETGEGMNNQQLRDEVTTIVLAGHETTAATLAWTWYLLAQHPDVAHKLRNELDDVLAGRTPTFEDLPNLPYTRMVIDETLRLYPPVWSVARQAMEDDEIGGYHIPAKSPIVVSQYVTHRHPKFWDNPEAFDPERFSPERSTGRHKFAYFPFGGGPRICIGNNFALMEAQLLLATLAQHYELALVPEHPVVPEPLITLRLKHGLRMTIRKRERVA